MSPLSRVFPLVLLCLVLVVPSVVADDVRDQELIDPAALDDAWIRERTLAFAGNLSGERVYEWDAMLTRDPTISYRLMGSPTGDLAGDWLLARLEGMGYEIAYKQEFLMSCVALACQESFPETRLENVIAILPGKDLTKWALVGAHYDTRELTMGALDNGMGTSTVLHLAESFKAHADTNGPFETTLVFAFWDGEEWGLYGSSHFLADQRQAKEALGLDITDDVAFVMAESFDMPGLNWPAENRWVEYQGGEYAILNLRTSPVTVDDEWRCFSYGCYEDLKGADDFAETLQRFRNYQTLVHRVTHDWLGYPVEWVRVYDDAYGRSDHVPFLAAGIPGMRIQGSHDNEYPHYHQPTDTLENIEILAGGHEALVAGIDTETRAGGAVLFYAATMGDVGHYDPADPWHASESGTGAPIDVEPSPAPTFLLVLLAAGAFLLRRRTGA